MYYPNLRIEREKRKLSGEVVAAILNTTRQQYHLWESGKREIPAHKAIKLAEFYEVSLDILLDNGVSVKDARQDESPASIDEITDRLAKGYDSMVELMKSGAMSDGGIKSMEWVLSCIRHSTFSHATYLEKQLLEYKSKIKKPSEAL